MLKLNDGRTELFQWDTGRMLMVNAEIDQVHFAKNPFGRSIDADVTDGVVRIPDILLQTSGELNVWGFVGAPQNGYTKISKVFVIKPRNKPADYVFTPPEQTTLSEILQRIDKLEESGGGSGGITQETDPTVPEWAKQPTKPTYTKSEVGLENVDNVHQYSENNPPPYPVQSVNGKTGAVSLGAADVGARPSTWTPTASDVGALPAYTKIPAKTSDLQNDSGFITRLVSDLVNYPLKSDIYSRKEINEMISAIPKFSIEVVSELPTSNISATTVYLVGGGNGDDLYTEYIYVSGTWEILGSQRVDLTGYATESWVLGKLGDYLKTADLQAAIDAALAQAKASGEFDGAPGKTPVKGEDYFTDADIEEIAERAAKKVDVAVDDTLTQTGAAADAAKVGAELGEISKAIADLDASKADLAEVDNIVVEKVADEKGNIVDLIISELQGLPVFGVVDTNNIIKVTSQLSDGVYTLKYKNTDGTFSDIGTITVGNGEIVAYTNLADTALTTIDPPTISDPKWNVGYRINSQYAIVPAPGVEMSNLISVGDKKIIRIKGFNLTATNGRIYLYKNGTCVFYIQNADIPTFATAEGDYTEVTTETLTTRVVVNTSHDGFDAFRVGGTLSGTRDDVIITLDEEIV